MRAGELQHRILVEQPIRSQNSTGEEEIVWSMVGKVWASVEPMSGRERLAASQVGNVTDTRITLRWSPIMGAIDPTWRLTHLGVVYNVTSIDHVKMARKEIEIMATSGANLG